MAKYTLVDYRIPIDYDSRVDAGTSIADDDRIQCMSHIMNPTMTVCTALSYFGIDAHQKDYGIEIDNKTIEINPDFVYAVENLIKHMDKDHFFILFKTDALETFEKWFIKNGNLCKASGQIDYGSVTSI